MLNCNDFIINSIKAELKFALLHSGKRSAQQSIYPVHFLQCVFLW